MYKYILLLINIYYVLSFNNLILNNKFKIKKTSLLSNNNNKYFNNNNSRVLQTDSYLETLTLRHKNNIMNIKLIKNISLDNLLLYNNYIDVIYDNINKYIIIEFKNNSKRVYYYNNNFLHLKEIINNTKNDYINLNDYPLYITNSPFGFLLFEKNNDNN